MRRKSKTEARLTAEEGGWGRDLPLIHTDDTDRKGLPRINADERGLEEYEEEESQVVTMRM